MTTVPSLVSDEGSLVDKLNTKSLIWKYFGFVPDDNSKPSNTNKPSVKYAAQLSPRRPATQQTYVFIFNRKIHNLTPNWWRLVKRNAAYQQVRLLIRRLKICLRLKQSSAATRESIRNYINKQRNVLFGEGYAPSVYSWEGGF